MKMCLFFMSAAYIQVHFRLDFVMEANTMSPDQTACKDQSDPYCLKCRYPANLLHICISLWPTNLHFTMANNLHFTVLNKSAFNCTTNLHFTVHNISTFHCAQQERSNSSKRKLNILVITLWAISEG